MSVNSELDNILSDAPSVEQDAPAQTTAPTTDATVARDESGRFAPKTAPSADVVEPAAHVAGQQQQNGNIPVAAIQAERDKRQEAQLEAEALRREIAELRGMVKAGQPAPTPQEPKAPATLWDDPDAFLGSQLTPLQQQLQEMREELWENKAAATHTPEAVQSAKAAAEALFGTPEGKQLHQQITAAGGNPFDNLVKWHQQQTALARVGSDPDAWLNAEIEKRLSDPAEQAKILDRIRNGAASIQATQLRPLTQLPPSLSRMPASSHQGDDNDASDSALFSHAIKR